MLNLSNVSKAFAGRVLFEDVALTVNHLPPGIYHIKLTATTAR